MEKRWVKLFESMKPGTSLIFTSDISYMVISSSEEDFQPIYYSSNDDDDLYLAIAFQINLANNRANSLADKDPT